MSEQQNIQSKKEKGKSIFTGLFSYEWILKNLVFFLFLSLLAVVYIANGHWADNMLRDINATEKKVKDLQYQYKSLKGEEINKSRENVIVESVTPLGLKISQDLPAHISLDSLKSKN